MASCVERINEHDLAPLLEHLLEQFPFVVCSFHSDNGSAYINRRTTRLPAKLRGEFTMSSSRHSNDNTLAESGNGAVVRKWMSYQFLPSAAAAAIHVFYRDRLNSYANFHRAGAFASLTPDSRGKQYKQWRAHLETLAALPAERRSLRPRLAWPRSKSRFAPTANRPRSPPWPSCIS